MKSFKFVMLSALVTLSAFCAVWYSSCTKDNCKGVTCLHKGNCSGGSCVCPAGTGGSNCETVFLSKYTNTYTGTVTSNFNYTRAGNTLAFSADTSFTNMRVVWNDNGKTVSLPIVLSNTSSSGSSFTVTPTSVDTNTYTGSGSISATSASMNLTESHPNGPAFIFNMNNFTR